MLEIKKLTKYYGKTLGIKDLSLTLHEGEIFGFIGPNGAGKSTTIRSVMGLISKTNGEVYIDNKLFNKNNLVLKRLIGYLPSEVYLYEDLTVKQMLDYHEKFYNIKDEDRRKKLIKLLKLDEKKKIVDLSLGNKKKVGIALALLHNPKILILDEPTSGLDPIMQQEFFDLLKEEKSKGTTILYSTHILSEVSKICDRVGIIKDGCLLKVESVKNLMEKNLETVYIESKDIEYIKKDLNLKIVEQHSDSIKFKNILDSNLLIKKLTKYNINKLLIEESTLEELFIHYYK